MLRAVLLAGLTSSAAPASGQETPAPLSLPSGLQVSLLQVVWPKAGAQGGAVARFRFLAPELKKGADENADLKALCETVARPMLKAKGGKPDQVIVSLSSEPLKLGETRPDVVQVIDAFVVKADHCEEAAPW